MGLLQDGVVCSPATAECKKRRKKNTTKYRNVVKIAGGAPKILNFVAVALLCLFSGCKYACHTHKDRRPYAICCCVGCRCYKTTKITI